MKAVILTALPVEYTAVRKHLTEIVEHVHQQGTVYEQGRFEQWDVLIAEIGAGNNSAAMETERAINAYAPHVVLFVGVAGGIKDVALGDVVVSSKVYGYESGKSGADFRARPAVIPADYSLKQRAMAEAKKDDWRIRLPNCQLKPSVFVAPIAAGEKVVNSQRASVCKLIRATYSDAIAVEMEGIGCLTAVNANKSIAIVVRGISDLLAGKSISDKAGWQETASGNAAAFAFEILSKFRVKGAIAPENSLNP